MCTYTLQDYTAMDYSSSSSSIFVLSLVILFCSIESSSAQYTYSPFYGKVSLALHYESLCPYCSNFMHGPIECELNTVEACALQVWPAQDKHFNFINCVETFVYNGQQSQWTSCYSKLGYEEEPINECYNSGLGRQLELGYAKATGALNPPHQYVPWVTVNDVPLYDDYCNFQTYVCNAYQGTMPAACQAQQMEIPSKTKSSQMLEVTFMDKTFPTTNIRSPMTKARRQMKF